ncbi:MAG: sensor domain-containing diguanylate cyclase [Actinomycetota bacterium]
MGTGTNDIEDRSIGVAIRRRAGAPAAVMVVMLIIVPLLSSLALSTQRVVELDRQRRDLAVLRSASEQLVHVVTVRALLSEEQNGVGLVRANEQLGFDQALANVVLGFDVVATLEETEGLIDEHLEAISPGLSQREPFVDRRTTDQNLETLSSAYAEADAYLEQRQEVETERLDGAAAALGLEQLDPPLRRMVAATDAHWNLTRMGSAFAGLLTPSLLYVSPGGQLRFLYLHRLGYDRAIEELSADGRTVPTDDPEVAGLFDAVDEALADVADGGTGSVAAIGEDMALTDIDLDTLGSISAQYRAGVLHRETTSVAAEELAVAIAEADAAAAAGIRRSTLLALGLVVITLGSVVTATLAIVRPLRRLARGAQQLGAGEAGVQVSVGGVRELQEAIRALNEASTSIAVAQERTQALADHVWADGGDDGGAEDDGLRARMAASFDVLESLMAEREEDRARFEHEAFHDSLTGLLNRRGLRHELGELLDTASAADEEFTVLYLDLDGFKAVNDTYGHDAGDAVLKAVAERIDDVTPPGNHVARMGGDEFVVVLSMGGDMAALGERVGKAMKAAIARTVDHDGRELHVGASVGYASGRSEEGRLDRLFTAADAAAYFAKSHRSPAPVPFSVAVEAWLAQRSATASTDDAGR